jgi:large subunit ribosomal protein L19
MNMKLVAEVTASQIRNDLPTIAIGDTVVVGVNIIEGNKKRVQDYQGLVIKMRGTGVSRSFTVRKISNGVGVERVFPLNSPVVAYVKVVSHGKVRRAKLYYLRDRKGKSARIKQKI